MQSQGLLRLLPSAVSCWMRRRKLQVLLVRHFSGRLLSKLKGVWLGEKTFQLHLCGNASPPTGKQGAPGFITESCRVCVHSLAYAKELCPSLW